jgi:hypothetical protein
MRSRYAERACQVATVLLALLVALPVVTDAAPRKVTKELADQLFRSPATPQDTALARSVKERVKAIVASETKPTPVAPTAGGATQPSGTGKGARSLSSPDWSARVTVEARSGHVRLGGNNLTPAQRALVESAVKSLPDVTSWGWGN